MRTLWRISNHGDLSGIGGERADARWHTAYGGKRVVYLAEHPALAILEILVNLESRPGLLPDKFQLMQVLVADTVSIEKIETQALSTDWRSNLRETQEIGNRWLKEKRSALLLVPAAPCPESWNLVFNPLHPDSVGVTIGWFKRLEFDKRLFHAR